MNGRDVEGFPKRIYTEDEVRRAKEFVDKGYKHSVKIKGGAGFREQARCAMSLLKTAGYYDFFRTYIRSVEEIDGLTQLRQAEAAIWANDYVVKNPVDAASVFVQKASHMKEYLEGTLYYGGQAEKRSLQKRIEFLETLKGKSREREVVAECERLIKMWSESSLAY